MEDVRKHRLFLTLPHGPHWVRLAVPEDAPNYRALVLFVMASDVPVRLTRDDVGIRHDPETELPTWNDNLCQVIADGYGQTTLATMPMGTWLLTAEIP